MVQAEIATVEFGQLRRLSDEVNNIVERVDITGDLLVPGRHLRWSIIC